MCQIIDWLSNSIQSSYSSIPNSVRRCVNYVETIVICNFEWQFPLNLLNYSSKIKCIDVGSDDIVTTTGWHCMNVTLHSVYWYVSFSSDFISVSDILLSINSIVARLNSTLLRIGRMFHYRSLSYAGTECRHISC